MSLLSSPAAAGFRALIVDDDELSRDVAASILRRLGATEVIEAASGAAAITWADSDPGTVDLILCDLRMPEIDGLQTLDELAKRTYPRLFVLASGADRRTIRAAAAAASQVGAARLRVVSKPVTLEKMRSIIDALAEAPAAQQRDWNLLQTSPPDCSSDMVRGLALGEFVPLLVPQVNCGDGRVDNVEAVWRWRHSRYGILLPESFITVAQTIGVLDEMFFMIVRQAICSCVAWRANGIAVGLSINIPPLVLTLRDLPQRLDDTARLQGLPPHQITLEVAETAWLQDRANSKEVLTRLRLKGFGLAIDNFGAGFSSIEQLLVAPFNEMKLDASSIALALDDREREIVLSSYLSVAHGLDLMVVAQGIETEAQRAHATQLGCDRMQGSLIGAPMTAEAFEVWFNSRSSMAQDVEANLSEAVGA